MPSASQTACTALLNCVVACGSKVTEDDSFDKLRELMDALSQETLNEALNYDPKGDKEALAKLSGTPLFLAAKVNVPVLTPSTNGCCYKRCAQHKRCAN